MLELIILLFMFYLLPVIIILILITKVYWKVPLKEALKDDKLYFFTFFPMINIVTALIGLIDLHTLDNGNSGKKNSI